MNEFEPLEIPGTRCIGTVMSGEQCSAWAVRGSDPPLCSIHAGLTYGRGAPRGNTNALKHGFYSTRFSPAELQTIADAGNIPLGNELLLVRVALHRLMAYFAREDLTVAEATRLAEALFRGAGRVQKLAQVADSSQGEIDWDSVLDVVSTLTGWDV